ncbi:unnamed protein product, partial [Brenthis ino]
MKILSILFLAVFLCGDVYGKKSKHRGASSNNRIVGGHNVTIEEFPYQVLLTVERDGENYECGGSIISTTHILTAAHCLIRASYVYVRLGATSSNDDGEIVTSTDFTLHPNYNGKTYNNDAAIIHLDSPLEIDGVRTKIIHLAEAGKQVNPGQYVTVTGWGATSEKGQGSDYLLAVEVPVVSNDDCRKSYKTLTERMFCAGFPEGGKDACQGDSGGPAVLKSDKTQVGIVSFGAGCARKGYPGVYTSVSSIRGWIEEVAGV